MNRTLLRASLLSLLTFVPAAVFYGCSSDDETAAPGAQDAAADSTSKADGAGGSDATTGSDTSATDSATTDATADVFVLPTNPCAMIVDAGADAAIDADAGDASTDAAPQTMPATARQTFTNGMVGCAGKVTHPNRAQLCNAAAGCAPCNAAEWVANAGGAAPAHQYWVNEQLNYSGSEFACGATTQGVDAAANVYQCDSLNVPMRVCVDGDGGVAVGTYDRGSRDENGNECNWTQCDFAVIPETPQDAGADVDATPPTTNLHFGGCDDNVTAGTLCCCK